MTAHCAACVRRTQARECHTHRERPAVTTVAALVDRPIHRVTRDARAGAEGAVDPVAFREDPGGGEEFPLPSDDAPRRFDHFEVMLVGHLRPPEPMTRGTVTLRVGDRERSLWVYGDRYWQRDELGAWTISEPEPFVSMPLSWSRAFGGAAQVEVDEGAFVPIVHPSNPRGRGLWPAPAARDFADTIGAAEGYPKVAPPGALPNLETPGAEIHEPTEAPLLPACWAPMPREMAARYAPAIESLPADPSPDEIDALGAFMARRAFTSAHPDWILDAPPEPGTPLVVEGLGAPLAFSFPTMRVHAEALVRGRQSSHALAPQSLIIFADERRVTLTYRIAFRYDYEAGDARALRLRLEGPP